MFSCPGLTSSHHPPGTNLLGRPLHLRERHADVSSVERTNSAKPSVLVNPSTPATAPAKQEDRNLIVYSRELLYCTFGGKRSCAAASGVVAVADMAEEVRSSSRSKCDVHAVTCVLDGA